MKVLIQTHMDSCILFHTDLYIHFEQIICAVLCEIAIAGWHNSKRNTVVVTPLNIPPHWSLPDIYQVSIALTCYLPSPTILVQFLVTNHLGSSFTTLLPVEYQL